MSPERSIESIEEKSRVTNPPADFSLYHTRRDLIAKRNATDDPVKREQINILIGQLTSYDRAVSELQKEALADAIKRQMALL